MKVLVLAAAYPDQSGSKALMFAHVRNQYYQKHGIDVRVLNFSAHNDYILDDIQVITLQSYIREEIKFDIAVCHAPNLRNHYRFLTKYGMNISRFVFVFHGHEVLRVNDVYPREYSFVRKQSMFRTFAQNQYDSFKFSIWRRFFIKNNKKSRFIFVSRWLYNEFCMNFSLANVISADNIYIIHNSVAPIFENENYDFKSKKEYDFISIRANLDVSKYCIDIVNNLALSNPNMKFLIIGNGEIFNHVKKAENITWIKKSLMHNEMLEYINISSCGLLPTRLDAQGVIACEMATYGIPLITSDISICNEIFHDFDNVATVLTNESVDLAPIQNRLLSGLPYIKNTRYFAKNTVAKEVELLLQMVNQ